MYSGRERLGCLTIHIVLSLLFVYAVSAQNLTIDVNTTWEAGEYTFDDVRITNNSTLTFNGAVKLNCTNLTIDPGSRISADYKGYSGGEAGENGLGPGGGVFGGGTRGSGGGYGGMGGDDSEGISGGIAYGSIAEPLEMGSGGGGGSASRGGRGGGAIFLNVSGTTVVNGEISAKGQNGMSWSGGSMSGGGSGGSIYIITSVLGGGGTIMANGGYGGNSTYAKSGGGSGGRIAIYGDMSQFTGTILASGGAAWEYAGAAGTVFTKSPDQTNGQLIIKNDVGKGVVTPILQSVSFDSVKVDNWATLSVEQGISLSTTDFLLKSSTMINKGEFTVNNFADLISGTFRTKGGINTIGSVEIQGEVVFEGPFHCNEIIVKSGGKLTHPENTDIATYRLEIVSNSFTLESGGFISADYKGYSGGQPGEDGQGPGGGIFGSGTKGSGGGYGGMGGEDSEGTSGGETYGSITEPLDLGSGGAGGSATWGGAGGGAIFLDVSGTLWIDGDITATGKNVTSYPGGSLSGGGSGGSIYIIANIIEGNGKITANGGYGGNNQSNNGGAGGGGRIAIYGDFSQYTGELSAYGGSAWFYPGGAGTIFLKTSTQQNGNLIVDNNSPRETTTAVSGSYFFDEITVTENISFQIDQGTNIITNKFIINSSSIDNNGSMTILDSLKLISSSLNTPNGNLFFENAHISVDGSSVYSGGELNVNSLLINSDGSFTYTINSDTSKNWMRINANNIIVESGGKLHADEKGWHAGDDIDHLDGYGPGGGEVGEGGNYGGGENVYGSMTLPMDMGSGGGALLRQIYPDGPFIMAGGDGGGIIILNVKNTLIVDGNIGVDGGNGQGSSSGDPTQPGVGSGGGSGGSIFIITDGLAGNGIISSRGGNGWTDPTYPEFGSGGGSGGRIAIYYNTSSFFGDVDTEGGSGAVDSPKGTVVMERLSPEASLTFAELNDVSNTESIFSETVAECQISLNDVIVTGDFIGELNSTSFEFVTIETGPFSDKGFFKCKWSAVLEGASCKGVWKGVCYPDPDTSWIRLEGQFSGDLIGVAGGYFYKSSGSADYDSFHGQCDITHVYNISDTNKIEMEGAVCWGGTTDYPSTLITVQQLHYDGNATGFNYGPLSLVMTNIHVSDDIPYQNEGFSICSYQSDAGSGQGFMYRKSLEYRPNILQFDGVFSDPMTGLASACLDQNDLLKNMYFTVMHKDVGANLMAHLRLNAYSSWRVSPGQEISYAIDAFNNGINTLEDVNLLAAVPWEVTYKENTGGGTYIAGTRKVKWIFDLPAKSHKRVSITGDILFGLEDDDQFWMRAYVPKDIEIEVDSSLSIMTDTLSLTANQLKAKTVLLKDGQEDSCSIEFTMNISDATQEIEPETFINVNSSFKCDRFISKKGLYGRSKFQCFSWSDI